VSCIDGSAKRGGLRSWHISHDCKEGEGRNPEVSIRLEEKRGTRHSIRVISSRPRVGRKGRDDVHGGGKGFSWNWARDSPLSIMTCSTGKAIALIQVKRKRGKRGESLCERKKNAYLVYGQGGKYKEGEGRERC